jgi:hypothetical protein
VRDSQEVRGLVVLAEASEGDGTKSRHAGATFASKTTIVTGAPGDIDAQSSIGGHRR